MIVEMARFSAPFMYRFRIAVRVHTSNCMSALGNRSWLLRRLKSRWMMCRWRDRYRSEARPTRLGRSPTTVPDDIDGESTTEHRRENGLIRRKSGSRSRDYEGSEFG